MSDVVYQERVVAFVDVLGFAQLVKASERNSVARAKIHKLVVADKLFDRVMDDPRFAGATFFSDSFVLSMEPDRIFYMVREVGHLCRFLLLHGLPCRGAITTGLLYHEGQFVIGPAFVAAYELELVACHPRVILDNTSMELWRMEFASYSAHAHLETLVKKDRDGQWFIDIFHPCWTKDFIQWAEIVPLPELVPTTVGDFLEAASQQIENGIAANAANAAVRAKYEWLADQCAVARSAK